MGEEPQKEQPVCEFYAGSQQNGAKGHEIQNSQVEDPDADRTELNTDGKLAKSHDKWMVELLW